ncbi:MAG: ATP-binding protein [candidate division KSB1 bacterium]|nr:ATP-binding protein [candidate division KSB1 bacterium]
MQSILDYAKPHPLSFDLYDVREVIDKSLMLIRKQMQKNRIRIEVEVAPDLGPVEMDAHQIEQVLVNLLTNAMRAIAQTGRDGQIAISAAQKGQYAVILVSDNGIGISKESLAHIFDPFYSLSSDGTGLGLTIARKIIEQHQGYIRVQSKPNKGARFSIHLPLRQNRKKCESRLREPCYVIAF